MKLTLCIVGVLAASTFVGCASQQTVATAEPVVVEETVTEVVPLQYWAAETALQLFGVQELTGASITVDPRSNSLILQGTAEDVERVRKTLQQIDVRC